MRWNSNEPLYEANERRVTEFQQIAWPGYSQCAGDSDDIDQADTSLAALNPTDIGPVKIRLFGQGLLGKPHRQAG